MTTLGIFNSAALTSQGSLSVSAGALVTVRRETDGVLASIFSDSAGLFSISQPGFVADSQGRFKFYAAALPTGYRIIVTDATSPGLSFTLRNVPIGTAQYYDASSYAGGLLSSADAPTLRAGLDSGVVGDTVFTADTPLAAQAPLCLENLALSAVPSGNQLIVSVVTRLSGGSPLDNVPSSLNPITALIRSATESSGTPTRAEITTQPTLTIQQGSTMGVGNNTPFRLWAVLFNDSGTYRLGLINCLTTSANTGFGRNADSIYPLGGSGIASAVFEGGSPSGLADSAGVFYSNASITNKPYAVLGYLEWGFVAGSPSESGLVVAGNWARQPTRIQVFGQGVPLPGQRFNRQRTQPGAVITGSAAIPQDNSIPLISEGTQAYALTISPSSPANALEVSSVIFATQNTGGAGYIEAALFRDAVANAIAAVSEYTSTDGTPQCLSLSACVLASEISSVKVRFGNATGATTYVNAFSGGSQAFGGVASSFLQVEEIMA